MTPPTLTQKVDRFLSKQYEWVDNIGYRRCSNYERSDNKYRDSLDQVSTVTKRKVHGSTMGAHFSVFYIDKYVDSVQSEWVTRAIAKRFKLQPQHSLKLSSGNPTLIRGSMAIEQASQIKQAITKLGGSAWIQLQNGDGAASERRSTDRRSSFDRRELRRTDYSSDRRSREDIRQRNIL